MNSAKLLGLAAKLETTTEPYDQGSWGMCALAHHYDHVGPRAAPQILAAQSTSRPFTTIGREFDVSALEAQTLFGMSGCGDARQDPKAAAAYIRNFVQVRTPVPAPMAMAA